MTRLISTSSPSSSALLGPALALLTVFCWASFNLAAVHGFEAVLQPIDPMLLRFGTAGLVLAPALILLRRRDGTWARRPRPGRAVILALLGGPQFGAPAVGGYAFAPLSHGLVFAPATVFAVGVGLAFLLTGKRVGRRRIAGCLVILTGLVMLSGAMTGGMQPGVWRGHEQKVTAPVEILLQAVMQGIVGWALSMAALAGTVRLLGAITASILPCLAPVAALALAVPVLGDWPSWREMLGVAIAIAITAVGARTAFIEPGSSWENGYCESFNARFRDELLNSEIFFSLREAQILIERWRRHYNTVRPHSALGYRPPAPETIIPVDQKPVMH